MKTILVVEDDENLRVTLADNLELEGYNVISAADVANAKSLVQDADLCLLDIMLPDGDGYQLCEWIRASSIDIPILMLTARTLERDLDAGFEAGADDYLGKPYRMKELLYRVKALLRRGIETDSQNDEASINGFDINWCSRSVSKDGQVIHCTKKEFDILAFLFANLETVKSRDEILNAVWGENVFVDNRTVDNFVANIKKRLNLKAGDYQIRSVRGVGYCMEQMKK